MWSVLMRFRDGAGAAGTVVGPVAPGVWAQTTETAARLCAGIRPLDPDELEALDDPTLVRFGLD